jgi:hypothetical protein
MRVIRARSLFAAGTTAVACAIAMIVPGAASAQLKQLPDGQVVSYMPLRSVAAREAAGHDNVFTNMDYNGGPIMPRNTDYMIFWSPSGYSAFGDSPMPEYVTGIGQFFKDLAHDSGGNQNVDSVATQYNDLTGAFVHYTVTYGGTLLDTDPYPASRCPVEAPNTECFTDGQLQKELASFVTAHHLKTDLEHEYFVFTPPHIQECFTDQASAHYGGCSAGELPSTLAAYCAYHQETSIDPMLFYAFESYVAGNPGCDDGNHPNGISDGAIEGGLSHEHNESVTDPIPNDAWTNGSGPNQGQEVGDQCETQNGPPLGTAPNGAVYNQVINGHYYWYQEEWSNDGHTCLQRYTRPSSLPTATDTVTADGGTTMTFDATGSTAPGGVADFSWQFNDAFAAPTQETTTPTIVHTFPEAGSYSTGLAVFGPNGQSIGTGGIVTTGHNGFTPAFTVTTANPTAGQPVSFNALRVVSRRRVLVYLWQFGDGSTGTGPTPSHTYAAPGTYQVKAVLFSGIGSAYPGAGAAPVYAQNVTVK